MATKPKSAEENAERKRYEQLADEFARQILDGVLRPGDRLPSVRATCEARQLSPSTVFQAYYLLEAKGLVRAMPRSGYFVNPHAKKRAPEPARSTPLEGAHAVDITDLVFEVLGAAKSRDIVPLGSPCPHPRLFPLDALRRSLTTSTRKLNEWSAIDDLPPGNERLRRQIGKRYLAHGHDLSLDEIVLTNGAMEALSLSLQAVARPGDAVVVESPCFYAALQSLERLGLTAIEVPTHPGEGADLSELARVLERDKPKACWLMTNFQNPLGCSMSREKKRALVQLLARHAVPLIEDDVYGELYHGSRAPDSAKSFDRNGLVLHCSSFSKSLAPGYRVGWVAAGRYGREVRRLKLMTSLSGSIPAQAALADYLQQGGYDRHLRRLRETLGNQKQALVDAVTRHFPAGTRLTRPEGGYFVWADLPWEATDAMTLHRLALAAQISIAPGPMFSNQGDFRNCLRLNFGHPWGPQLEKAVQTVGRLARPRLGQRVPSAPVDDRAI